MGKINLPEITEPSNNPLSGNSFLYIDSADSLLTSMDDVGNVKKYITTLDIPLSWLDSAINFLDMTTSEPASPTTGDRYINTVTGTSSETSQSVTENNVYEWTGAAWNETVAADGDAIMITNPDPNEAYTFNGAAWINYGSVTSHNVLSSIQGGTSGEYYHLTSADYGYLTDGNAQLENLQTDGSPTFSKISIANYAGDYSQISVYDSSISTFTKGSEFYVDETNGITSIYYAGDGAGGIDGSITFKIKDTGASYTDSITTTGDAFNISASALTTGNLLNIASSQSSTGARTLLNIENIDSGATGTTLLKISNSSTGLAVDCTGNFDLNGGFILNEVASSPVAAVAGKGVLWVRNDSPNELVFTDDDGNDWNVAGDSAVDTLAEVLAVGNTTEGNDIVLSGTDSYTAVGTHTGYVLLVNAAHTTSNIISVSAPLLTTGSLANLTSSSSDISTRNLVQIQNLNSAATGATPLYVGQLANNTAVNIIASGVTNTYALNVEADGLILEGSIARFYSNSSNTQTRDLVTITNNSASAIGSTCLAIYQNGDAPSIYVDSDGTTSLGIEIEGHSLTTGKLAKLHSTSSDTSTRNLVEIINDSPSATGATCLYVQQDSSYRGIVLNADGITTGIGLDVYGSGLTSGTLANFYSDSADTSVRNIVKITNDNAATTATTTLSIQNDGGGSGIGIYCVSAGQSGYFRSTGTNTDGFVVIADSLTTGDAFSINANALTTGNGALVYSNSADTSTRNLVSFVNDNSSATGTTCLHIQQDSTGLALDSKGNVRVTGSLDVVGTATLADDTITSGYGFDFTTASTDVNQWSLGRFAVTDSAAVGASALTLSTASPDAITLELIGGQVSQTYAGATGIGYYYFANNLTTGTAFSVEGSALTTGGLAYFYSNSSDTSSRSLVEIINDNSLSTGTTSLYVRNDSNNQALDIDCIGLTSSRGVNIEANSITTGQVLRVYSNSSDTSTRVLTYLVNDNAAASGARLLQMQQDADAISWYLDQNGDGNAIYLDGAGNVTTDCISVIANNLTSGSLARFYSNSASTTTRNLIEIINDNSAAVSSTNLYLQQDADGGFAINATGTNARSRFLTSFEVSRVTVAGATYSVVGEDNVIFVSYTTAGTVTITIPTAQMYEGRILRIKDSGGNATVNNITIATGGSETIDGSATLVINDNYQSVTLASDGNNWFVI